MEEEMTFERILEKIVWMCGGVMSDEPRLATTIEPENLAHYLRAMASKIDEVRPMTAGETEIAKGLDELFDSNAHGDEAAQN